MKRGSIIEIRLRFFILFLFLFITGASFSFGFHCQNKDNGIYLVMFPSSIHESFHSIYRSSDVSYTSFAEYGNIGAGQFLSTGDTLCLPAPKEVIYNPVKGETLWNIWNRYSSYYGITFSQFVIYNNEKTSGIQDASLDPYEQNKKSQEDITKSFTTLYLDDSSLAHDTQGNDILLENINILDPDKKIQDIYSEEDYSDLIGSIKRENDFYSINYVIIGKEIFDSSSLHAGALSAQIFSTLYPDPVSTDISVLIIEGITVALTYPENNPFDDIDSSFYDTLIDKSNTMISEGKTLEEVLFFIDKEINLAAILVLEGIDGQSNLEMNGDPSLFNLPILNQDLDRLSPVPISEQVIYLSESCYPSAMEKMSSFIDELKRYSINYEVLNKWDKAPGKPEDCLSEEDIVSLLRTKDNKGYHIHFFGSDSSSGGKDIQSSLYSSIKGGIFLFFVKSSLKEDIGLTRKRDFFSQASQVSIGIPIEKISSSDYENIISGIKQFNAWDNLVLAQKMTDVSIVSGDSLYDAIDKATSEDIVSEVIKKIILVESKGVPTSKSDAGCKGLLHLCQYTASHHPESEELCDKEKGCSFRDDRFDPEKNIAAGVSFFENVYNQFRRYSSVKNLMYLSYYGGPQLTAKAIEKAGTDDFEEVLKVIDGALVREVYCPNGYCIDFYYKTEEQQEAFSELIIRDTLAALQ
jgi:hypothetical protein